MKEALISGNWEKTILLGSTKEKIIMFFVQDLTLRDLMYPHELVVEVKIAS